MILLHIGKSARIPLRSGKDGYERILRVISISFLLGYIWDIPITLMLLMFVRNGLTFPVFCVFDKFAFIFGFNGASMDITSTLLMTMWVFLVGLSIMNGLININLYVTGAILYTNSTRLWMTKLWRERVQLRFLFAFNILLLLFGNSKQIENERDQISIRKHQQTYTAHQVMNKLVNDVFANLVEFSNYIAAILLTLAVYVIVRFYKSGSGVLPLFLIFAAILCFSLVSNLVLAAACHSTSTDCIEVQKKYGSLNGKYDKMFWISRKPTSIRVGDHFSLRSKTYVLEVFGITVLKTVIDLLVTF